MKIRVHYPKTKEGKAELQRRINEVHTEIVIDRINNLDCSYEQKIKIVDGLNNERMCVS